MKIWALISCFPEETAPVYPHLFLTRESADKAFDEIMREEWDHYAPGDDDGEPLPYPGDPAAANEAIHENDAEESWGQWELICVEVPRKPVEAPPTLSDLKKQIEDLDKKVDILSVWRDRLVFAAAQ
jgi:hypothetical protein